MDARLANNRSVESAARQPRGLPPRGCARSRSPALVDAQDGLAAEIKKRGEKMVAVGDLAQRQRDRALPPSLPPAATGGVPDANVLVDDYWDVYKVLLR